MLYKLLIIILNTLHYIKLQYRYKQFKTFSGLVLESLCYGFCKLYKKDNTIFMVCMLSLLFKGMAVAIVERILRTGIVFFGYFY